MLRSGVIALFSAGTDKQEAGRGGLAREEPK